MTSWNDNIDNTSYSAHHHHGGMGEGSHINNPHYNNNIERILQAFWDKKYVMIAIILTFTMLGVYYTKSLAPQFKTNAVLSVQRDELLPSAVSKILGLAESNFEINTHIEVMRSHDMISRLVNEMGLQHDPEFAPKLKDPSAYSDEQKHLMLVDNLRNAIAIRAAASASILRIEMTSKDPIKAAEIANRLADIFIKEHLDLKYQEVQRVIDWMESKKNELEEQVNNDAQILREFQTSSGIVGSNILQFHNQEFLQLNAKLLEAEQKYSEAKARLTFIRKQSSKGSGLYSLSEVMNSNVVANLKREETQKQAELAQLTTRFGSKHPEYIAAKADLESIRSDIHTEVRNIVKNLENSASSNKARVEDLETRIDGFQEKFKTERNEQLIRLQELQQKVEASRKLYENFLVIYQQAAPQSIISDSNIKIVSYARPPVFSSYPNKKMLVVLSFMIGGFFAVFAALLLDKMNGRFRTLNDIEVFTGFPIYSAVPETKLGKNKKIVRYVLDRPTSKAAESMRSLRMNLTLRAHESENIQIVNFTSTYPNEGKSTTSVWFAALSAKAGERVLLIDCDMRRPKLHHNLGLNVSKSLVDYLTDRASLTDIIQRDEASGMDVIPCKPTPSHALSLLTSSKMQAMLDELRDEYDLIVIDSPAAASLSDPYILAKLSDRTLYVIDSDTTDRATLSTALKKFHDIHYYDLGLVINKVDYKKAGLESRHHLSYAYLDDDKAYS